MEEKIWKYIVKTYFGGKTSLSCNDFAFDQTTLDSLSHVKLIFFLENEFNIVFSREEMDKQNLNTVTKIVELVRKKQNGA